MCIHVDSKNLRGSNAERTYHTTATKMLLQMLDYFLGSIWTVIIDYNDLIRSPAPDILASLPPLSSMLQLCDWDTPAYRSQPLIDQIDDDSYVLPFIVCGQDDRDQLRSSC